jgi:hypothetical protein
MDCDDSECDRDMDIRDIHIDVETFVLQESKSVRTAERSSTQTNTQEEPHIHTHIQIEQQ